MQEVARARAPIHHPLAEGEVMKLRTIGATLALLLVARGETLAQGTSESSSPVQGSPAYEAPARLALAMPATFSGLDAPPAPGAVVPSTDAGEFMAIRTASRFEAVRYIPRRGRGYRPVPPRSDAVIYQPRYRPPPKTSGAPASRGASTAHMQLHGGFVERNGHGATSFAVGFRGGPTVGEIVQLGIGADWYHESESERDVVSPAQPHGGRDITTTHVLSRTNADLIPIQAHLQLDFGRRAALFPYVGVAGGYQLLLLSAEDYETGASYDATFGGWGWQAFGGMALRLSGQARLFGEVFMNTANVERDIQDPVTGVTFREVTDTDAVGMRFGLNWGI
jgi:hypothetical protein